MTVHGAPLGNEEIAATREQFWVGVTEPFVIPC